MRRLDRPCTLDDGAEFFLDYILADHIGLVASRHLIISDNSQRGSLDPNCLLLAKLQCVVLRSASGVLVKRFP